MELFSFPNLVLMPFFDMICLASASAHQDAASSSTVGTTDTYTTSIGPTSTSTPWYLEADGSLRATTYVIIVAVVVVVVALSITCCCCCCSRRGKSTEPPYVTQLVSKIESLMLTSQDSAWRQCEANTGTE